MKNYAKFLLAILALPLLAWALLHSASNVLAAPPGVQIAGTVSLEGTPPNPQTIDMSSEPDCVKAHANHPVTSESVVTGPNGGLKNVVIYISEGLSTSDANHVPSQPAILDQKGCQYVPHVVAVDVGQQITILNSDAATHNIHVMPKHGGGNPEWNKSQFSGASPIQTSFPKEEVIPVKCNVHPWMRGYIVVVRGPYTVSDETGSFVLATLPPGTYTLTAWHETYGTQTQKITVTAGQRTAVKFVFKAK